MSAMEYNSGRLKWGRNFLDSFTKDYSLPLYVYDLSVLRQNIRKLKSNLPSHTEIHYAVKANSHSRVLKEMASAGLGMDVVSGGEIEKVLESECAAEKIVFSGVAKSKSEIDYALEVGIGVFNVESMPELERIAQRAETKKAKAPIAIRVNPDVSAETHPHIHTGGAGDKFGVPIDQVGKAIEFSQTTKNLELKGFTLHVGSQLMKFDALMQALDKVWPLFKNLDPPITQIDIGGGIGYDYIKSQGIELDEYATLISNLHSKTGCQVLIEPGRWLVAGAGVLISRVEYTKFAGNKQWLIVDTGMNHLMRPALYQTEHRILPLKEPKGEKVMWDVVGPICESTDVLSKNIELPDSIKEEDFIAILDTGAYGYELTNHYNSRPLPKQIIID